MPDIARIVQMNGLTRVAGASIRSFITDIQGSKMNAKEARLFGTAWDMILNRRARSMDDLASNYGRMTPLAKAVHHTSQKWSMINLLAPWNQKIKEFTAIVTGQKIAEFTIQAAKGKISKANIDALAHAGISEEMAIRIANQLKGRKKSNGVILLGTEEWTDDAAKEIFRLSLRREVDRTIITPGVGDRPLFMQTQMGRTLFQYRSFAMAATQRVFLAGLQNPDTNFLNGSLLSVAIGAMSVKARADFAGWDPPDDYRWWLGEAVESSGQFGTYADFLSLLNTATSGAAEPTTLLPGGPSNRMFTGRTTLDYLLGPTFGTLKNLDTITREVIPNVVSGTPSQIPASGMRALARMTPPRNTLYTRNLFDSAVDGINTSFRDRQKRQREEEIPR
jgi:hypothetical protein